MKTLSKLVSTGSVSLLVASSPVLITSGSFKSEVPVSPVSSPVAAVASYRVPLLAAKAANTVSYLSDNSVTAAASNVTKEVKTDFTIDAAAKKEFEIKLVIKQATSLYDSMKLARTGLDKKAFEYAWRGYHNLVKQGKLAKTNVLSICDFTQSSRKKRLYVIDIVHKKLMFNTYVAHGMNSGLEYATSFSNRPESFKTSLGFYMTTKSYYGHNGVSLKVAGLEKGYNDLAAKRNIVLHGANYVTNDYMKNNGEMGRSLGCAAIPSAMSPRIIKTIKNGSCLFIYHPTKKYLLDSQVING